MSDTMNIFGETLPVTKTKRLRSTTLAALLRRRPDLTCKLTHAFDSMVDGSMPRDEVVDVPWVIERVLSHTRTLSIYQATRLGTPVISAGNASYDVDIYDAETKRRELLVQDLPHERLPGATDTLLRTTRGYPKLWGVLRTGRINHLSTKLDGLDFDEEIERLRALTEFDELAGYLEHVVAIRLAPRDQAGNQLPMPSPARPNA
jgi:hypothetical protein